MADTRVVLGLEGMTCSSCSGTIDNLLQSLEGIVFAQVTLSTNSAVVEFKSSEITSQHICEEVESVGFGCEVLTEKQIVNEKKSDQHASGKIKSVNTTKSFVVCFEENILPSQINLLTNNIRGLDGVFNVTSTGFSDKKALQVNLDDSKVGPRHLFYTAQQLNLSVSINSHGGFTMAHRLDKQYNSEMNKQALEVAFASILTIPVLIISHLVGSNAPGTEILMTSIVPGLDTCGLVLFLLTSPVQWIVGYRFHKKAVLSMQSGTLGMDFLISTGTSAAYLFSFIALVAGILTGQPNDLDAAYFETAAVLITVVVVGKFLETCAKAKTANAIHSLSTQRARTARIVNDISILNFAASRGLWIGPQITLRNSQNAPIYNTTKSLVTDTTADEEIDASLVNRGDCVRLVAGEVIPADGIIISGTVGIDESMLTGESALVTKTVEGFVYGGTVVAEGSAVVVVTACGDDSTLGKIVSTVQEAQSSKPPIQEMADVVAKYFVPFVAGTSFLTFSVWMTAYYLGRVPPEWYTNAAMTESHMKHHMGSSSGASNTGNPVLFAFFFALAVWVSACPCAFGLATPTAILVATGIAAKHGILVRRGAALQHASEIKTIAFDKTGTLTEGKPRVTDFFIIESNGLSRLSTDDSLRDDLRTNIEEENMIICLLSILQSAETKSSHPLANGIVDFCRNRILMLQEKRKARNSSVKETSEEFSESDSFDVHAGQGISMQVKIKPTSSIFRLTGNISQLNAEVLVGNVSFLQSKGVIIPATVVTTATSLRSGGKVAVFAAIATKLVAIIGLSDTIRPEAPAVLNYLREQGISCYMVTGDDWNTAVAIGAALGIESRHIYADAKPSDKENFVRALQEYQDPLTGKVLNQKCLFIGDGTNDSPAMARASVGVAMAGGTDIALEAGDAVFCKNSLQSLSTLISLAKTTMRRIWINFGWALGYNMILIPVAAGVFFPVFHVSLAPMMAGMAMAFSSISIVISSLLLGLYQPPQPYQPVFKTIPSKALKKSEHKSVSFDIESGVELRDISSESTPLTLESCNCSPSSPSSFKRSIEAAVVKRMNTKSSPLASPSNQPASFWNILGREDRQRYNRVSTDEGMDFTNEGRDDTSVASILHRVIAVEGSNSVSFGGYYDGRPKVPASPISNVKGPVLHPHGSSTSPRCDGDCGCGCGKLHCRCPPTCSCKSY